MITIHIHYSANLRSRHLNVAAKKLLNWLIQYRVMAWNLAPLSFLIFSSTFYALSIEIIEYIIVSAATLYKFNVYNI